jgi:hypothetical protein
MQLGSFALSNIHAEDSGASRAVWRSRDAAGLSACRLPASTPVHEAMNQARNSL